MRVGAVVLAAGRATRMGGPKVTLPWADRTLLGHVLAVLPQGGVGPIVVVAGPDTPPLALPAGVRRVEHPEARQGMGTSIAAGVRALGDAVDAALICLGDQPGIVPATVRALLAALRPPHLAAAPVYQGGIRGHPVLFSKVLFAELGALQGDQGARAVLLGHPWVAVSVDAPAPADIDTPEDYARLLGRGQTREDRPG